MPSLPSWSLLGTAAPGLKPRALSPRAKPLLGSVGATKAVISSWQMKKPAGTGMHRPFLLMA